MNKIRTVTRTLQALLVSCTLVAGAGWTGIAAAHEDEATAEGKATAEQPAAEKKAVTRGTRRIPRRHGYRDSLDRQRDYRRNIADARHKGMELWRSQRRWWNNPRAEERRLWNKSRNRWIRDAADARRDYWDRMRPRHGYDRWRTYP